MQGYESSTTFQPYKHRRSQYFSGGWGGIVALMKSLPSRLWFQACVSMRRFFLAVSILCLLHVVIVSNYELRKGWFVSFSWPNTYSAQQPLISKCASGCSSKTYKESVESVHLLSIFSSVEENHTLDHNWWLHANPGGKQQYLKQQLRFDHTVAAESRLCSKDFFQQMRSAVGATVANFLRLQPTYYTGSLQNSGSSAKQTKVKSKLS